MMHWIAALWIALSIGIVIGMWLNETLRRLDEECKPGR